MEDKKPYKVFADFHLDDEYVLCAEANALSGALHVAVTLARTQKVDSRIGFGLGPDFFSAISVYAEPHGVLIDGSIDFAGADLDAKEEG